MSEPKYLTEAEVSALIELALKPLSERMASAEGRLSAMEAMLMTPSQSQMVEERMLLTVQETGLPRIKIAGKLRKMLGSSKIYLRELADRMIVCLDEIRAAHAAGRS